MNYKEALKFIKAGRNKVSRTVKGQRATCLKRIDDKSIAVYYHFTPVVTLHSDGSFTLRTSGYNTMTTRSRINEYILRYSERGSRGGRVFTDCGTLWYSKGTWRTNHKPVFFQEFMRIDGNGNVLHLPNKKEKRTIDEVRKEYRAERRRMKIERDKRELERDMRDNPLKYSSIGKFV